MSERIPERLVRVDYQRPGAGQPETVYFEDDPCKPDRHYRKALVPFAPDALWETITRNVRPTPTEACS